MWIEKKGHAERSLTTEFCEGFKNLYLMCYYQNVNVTFTPQPLRAVRVLFSPMVSGWAGGWREKVCLGPDS